MLLTNTTGPVIPHLPQVGNITSTPYITTSAGYSQQTAGSVSVGYAYPGTTPVVKSYFVITLPEPQETQPEEVFWCGRMLTLGVLGSKAEVAFGGKTLILDGKVANQLFYNNEYTLTLKYPKRIYYYHLDRNLQEPQTKLNSNILNPTLLSVIERDGSGT